MKPSSRERDPFAILGVSDDADDDAIDRAYRERALYLAAEYSGEQASRHYADLRWAYGVARDPGRRRRLRRRRGISGRLGAIRIPPRPLRAFAHSRAEEIRVPLRPIGAITWRAGIVALAVTTAWTLYQVRPAVRPGAHPPARQATAQNATRPAPASPAPAARAPDPGRAILRIGDLPAGYQLIQTGPAGQPASFERRPSADAVFQTGSPRTADFRMAETVAVGYASPEEAIAAARLQVTGASGRGAEQLDASRVGSGFQGWTERNPDRPGVYLVGITFTWGSLLGIVTYLTPQPGGADEALRLARVQLARMTEAAAPAS